MDATQILAVTLSVIGALFLIGVSLLRGSISGLRADVAGVSETQDKQGERLVRIETILTGADGSNGLNGDVKQLRARSHAQGDALHTVNGKLQEHEFRLDAIERRHGPADRRAS